MAFCGLSHPILPNDWPDTAPFAYLRFHGLGRKPREHRYSEQDLIPWADLVATRIADGKEVYAFFGNDFQALAARNVKGFAAMVAAKLKAKGIR